MEIINYYDGDKETVWAAAKDFLRNEPLLAEAGEECSTTTLLPVHFEWKLWFHFIHTGAAAEFLVALCNRKNMKATVAVLKRDEWEISSIMRTAVKSVQDLFPDASFREKRSILLKLGKGAYRILSELNQKTTWDDESKNLETRVSIDVYQHLLDVDWIEDCMGELVG